LRSRLLRLGGRRFAVFEALHQLDAGPAEGSGDALKEHHARALSGLDPGDPRLIGARGQSYRLLAHLQLFAAFADDFAKGTLRVGASHNVGASMVRVQTAMRFRIGLPTAGRGRGGQPSMTLTLERLTEDGTQAELESIYRKLRPRPNGPGHDAVRDHQRARLYAAMIDTLPARGYEATNITELCKRAHVSTKSAYQLFGNKQGYFLATYDHVVDCAVNRIGTAYARGGGWRERLRRAFVEFADLVVEEPNAARLVLVELLGVDAGPALAEPTERTRAVVRRMEGTRGVFERMVGASFSEAPGGVRLPRLVTKGIVCGVERITRQRLLAGGIEELPELADELLDWALSYSSAEVARLSELAPAPPRARPPVRARARNERARVLSAAASLAASNGYTSLTPVQITERAGTSLTTFNAMYPSVEQCFLAALDRLGLEALVCAAEGSQATHDRLARVHKGIAALMDRVADDPVLRRVAFVEVFAVGPAGIDRREQLLHRFSALLTDTLPADLQASELIVEAIVGAIWGLVHHHVVHGAAHRLPDLTHEATYLALAPLVGPAQALETILADPILDDLEGDSRGQANSLDDRVLVN
jgi:AcrR family transcriptional regulator